MAVTFDEAQLRLEIVKEAIRSGARSGDVLPLSRSILAFVLASEGDKK